MKYLVLGAIALAGAAAQKNVYTASKVAPGEWNWLQNAKLGRF